MAKDSSTATSGMVFALFLLIAGSLTIGDIRLTPFQVTPVPKELADKVDTDENPVQFFDTEEAAKKKVADLKAQAEARKPKPQ